MGAYRPTGLRMLAPISLVAFAVVFLIVIVSSLDGGSGSEEKSRRASEERTVKRTSEARRTGPDGTSGTTGATGSAGTRRVYVVKAGDTLVKISNSTGVSIEQLLSLNPEIDPQGLVTGQRVKLRE
jgi:LysM repeat protein